MITTRILVDADKGWRSYSGKKIAKFVRKKLNLLDNTLQTQLAGFFGKHQLFSIDRGMVDLDDVNYLYNLDYIPHSSDLRLPENPVPGNWVSLYYNQEDMALSINFDEQTKIKIHGRGENIMGYSEPLVCDVQFSCIKLTYVDKQNGWVLT
jgi:hypothetical protein